MVQALSNALEITLWVEVLVLSVQIVRAPHETTLRYLTLGLLFLAASHSLAVVQFETTALERLLANLCGVAAVYFQACFFRTALRHRDQAPPGLWRETVLAVAVAVVGTAGWLAAPPELRPTLGQPRNATVPGAFVFSVSIVGYFALVAARTIGWCALLARRLGGADRTNRSRPVVSAFLVGVVIIGLGSLLRLLSSSEKLVAEVAVALDPSLTGLAQSVYPQVAVLADIGFVVFLIGVLVPVLAGVAETVPAIVRHRRHLRTLGPLWRDLHAAYPDVRLRTRRSVHGRFYRRGLEIKDGLIELSPYFDPVVAGREEPGEGGGHANGTTTRASAGTSPACAAALIRDALALHRERRPPESPAPIPSSGADDWATDMAWLLQVAEAYTSGAKASPGEARNVGR